MKQKSGEITNKLKHMAGKCTEAAEERKHTETGLRKIVITKNESK